MSYETAEPRSEDSTQILGYVLRGLGYCAALAGILGFLAYQKIGLVWIIVVGLPLTCLLLIWATADYFHKILARCAEIEVRCAYIEKTTTEIRMEMNI